MDEDACIMIQTIVGVEWMRSRVWLCCVDRVDVHLRSELECHCVTGIHHDYNGIYNLNLYSPTPLRLRKHILSKPRSPTLVHQSLNVSFQPLETNPPRVVFRAKPQHDSPIVQAQ